jgi:DNA-binding response OmpR family regulator
MAEPGSTILIVSKGDSERRALARILASAGFVAIATASIEEASIILEDQRPAAIVADLGRGESIHPSLIQSSISACVEHLSDTPVIALVGKSCTELGSAALAGGAVDVVFRPLIERDLLLCLRSIIRRRQISDSATSCELTPREQRVLDYFEQRNGTVVTHGDALGHLGDGYSIATLRLVISDLRRKLEASASATSISTVRGIGYRVFID